MEKVFSNPIIIILISFLWGIAIALFIRRAIGYDRCLVIEHKTPRIP